MAYVAYEDLIPAQVNYRIVPKLRKYYRADGTFDLFDINKRQMCCFNFLTSRYEFGLSFGRQGDLDVSFGTMTIITHSYNSYSNDSTLTTLSLSSSSRVGYGSVAGHDLKLKLNNSAGYYPYYVRSYKNSSAGKHHPPIGYGYIALYNNKTSSLELVSGSLSNNNTNVDLSYNMNFNSPSTLWDYKDYSYVRLHGYAYDGSKFASAGVAVAVYGIHKFNDTHPLYRYYR